MIFKELLEVMKKSDLVKVDFKEITAGAYTAGELLDKKPTWLEMVIYNVSTVEGTIEELVSLYSSARKIENYENEISCISVNLGRV